MIDRIAARTALALVAASASLLVLAGCATSSNTSYAKPAGSDQYVKATTLRKAGDQDGAIAAFEKSIALNPSLTMAQIALGELFMAKKDFGDAVPHLEIATQLDPYTVGNHYKLGLSLQMLNRLQDASQAYLKGLKVAPDDFKCNMNLGLCYFALNQLDPAAFYLEKATRIDPTNARAWSNIGVVYDARGNLTFAEASYRKALELEPTNEPTLINLTSNLINQKKPADAVAIARQLVTVNGSPLSKKRLGDAFVAASQWNEAAAAYDSALSADARFVLALNAKAEMYVTHYENDLRLDDSLREQALSTWADSLKLYADQPVVKEKVAKYSETKVFR